MSRGPPTGRSDRKLWMNAVFQTTCNEDPESATARGRRPRRIPRACKASDVARRRNGRGMPKISRLMSDSAEHLPICGSVPFRYRPRMLRRTLSRALRRVASLELITVKRCSVLPGEASARICKSRDARRSSNDNGVINEPSRGTGGEILGTGVSAAAVLSLRDLAALLERLSRRLHYSRSRNNKASVRYTAR